MDTDAEVADLRAKAAMYRKLGRAALDDAAAQAAFKLAAELEEQARKIAQQKPAG
jgi:hypothetical protein